jgi:hypothetical protein
MFWSVSMWLAQNDDWMVLNSSIMKTVNGSACSINSSELEFTLLQIVLFFIQFVEDVKSVSSYLPAYEDGTVFRNVGI